MMDGFFTEWWHPLTVTIVAIGFWIWADSRDRKSSYAFPAAGCLGGALAIIVSLVAWLVWALVR